VQLARELGALGVRGNHEYEVKSYYISLVLLESWCAENTYS
jgi:hypothetical protein